MRERGSALVELIESFSQACEPDTVRWLDVGVQLRLVESPLDIAHTVQTRLIQPTQEEGSERAWIFTSATLGDDDRLRWFTEPCGLGDAEILRIGSPFDYPTQAAMYVPRHLPKPSDPGHSAQVAEFVARVAENRFIQS